MFLAYLAFCSPETFLPFAENKPSVFWWDGAMATFLSEVGEKGFFKLFCFSCCPEPRPPQAPAAALGRSWECRLDSQASHLPASEMGLLILCPQGFKFLKKFIVILVGLGKEQLKLPSLALYST